MADALVAELRRYLRRFQTTQEQLEELYRDKRSALIAARAADLLQIAETEAKLVGELKDQLGDRRKLLARSAGMGIPAESIRSIVKALDADARAELEPQIARAQSAATQNRRESWIHFIIAQRSLHQYNDLLELIAHCGQKSPTYSPARSQEASGGGAILDASA